VHGARHCVECEHHLDGIHAACQTLRFFEIFALAEVPAGSD
jgi:hypothetical protein